MQVIATKRTAQGSSASRRLRRANKVPGIVYGGHSEPAMIEIDHNPLWFALRVEAFHSSVLDLQIDGQSETVLLRDFQMHPYKPLILHIDFQRVEADHKLHVKVPLHYKGQENSPAVKLSHGIVSHVITEVDVSCMPKDLPEFIEVDLSKLEAGKSLHVSDIQFPAGVTPVLHHNENPVIVTVSIKGGSADSSES